MPFGAISLCKFVGTISLGLLTGTSLTHSTLTLPALLSLPSAPLASTTLSTLQARSKTLTSSLRHITTFTLFTAYLLSPRRARHPYLLYTSIFAFLSGPGVDAVVGMVRGGKAGERERLEREASGSVDEINGEGVREEVERVRVVEAWRAGVSAVAWGMVVVGIWGDGA
ncbi:hypothetical protein B0J11DRAFT_121548 [Dendryphion nanum]|uniref:Uncharacterized protein n=1 Tax=Dendryphion nanum TaxID=256645 RepID=A0A9P9IB85_9PLEO|nr:hypothetical protein B0J11DRAFT_121548 [Dendryphion nanum]